MTKLKPKISYQDFLISLKLLAATDFKKVLTTLESSEFQKDILEGEILLDDVLKAVGVIVPPVAIIANDLGVAITIEQGVILLFNLIHQMYPNLAAHAAITRVIPFEDEDPMRN